MRISVGAGAGVGVGVGAGVAQPTTSSTANITARQTLPINIKILFFVISIVSFQ